MVQETIGREFRFLSWYDVESCCLSIYRQMQANNYTPDSIIGLLRGGVVPARIFADYFGILLDFFALDVKLYDGIGVTKEEPIIRYAFKKKDLTGNILIVDDIFDSGRTMRAVVEHLSGHDVTTATLFWKENATEKPNYYAEVAEKEKWVIFPWEPHEFNREITKSMVGKK